MREFHTEVFDETIAGTGTTWYSPANYNSDLGSADAIALWAAATNVTGTASLTVQTQHSPDGMNWCNVSGTAEIPNTSLSTNPFCSGVDLGTGPVLLHYVRLAISLTGTSPQCRLKISVTGRTY